jgi:mRNA interferase MazF
VSILTRNEVLDHLNEVIVVPATRTIRSLTTEVVLSPEDGTPFVCALNFDHVSLAQRDRIGPALCILLESRWPEVRRALLVACGFSGQRTG